MSANNLNEIDVLRDVSCKLQRGGIPFMVTGSMAMNYYAQPRMTRDIDIVVSIHKKNIEKIIHLFQDAYYLSEEAVRVSMKFQSMFNIIHNESIVKVDFILLKSDNFQQGMFQRRKMIEIEDFQTYIRVS